MCMCSKPYICFSNKKNIESEIVQHRADVFRCCFYSGRRHLCFWLRCSTHNSAIHLPIEFEKKENTFYYYMYTFYFYVIQFNACMRKNIFSLSRWKHTKTKKPPRCVKLYWSEKRRHILNVGFLFLAKEEHHYYHHYYVGIVSSPIIIVRTISLLNFRGDFLFVVFFSMLFLYVWHSCRGIDTLQADVSSLSAQYAMHQCGRYLMLLCESAREITNPEARKSAQTEYWQLQLNKIDASRRRQNKTFCCNHSRNVLNYISTNFEIRLTWNGRTTNEKKYQR